MATVTLNKRAVLELKSSMKSLSGPLHSRFSAKLAQGLFQRIHKAFIIKSKGNADDQGLQWKPLKRSTIAARKIRGRGSLAFSRRGRTGRGLLTPFQNQKWKGIFSSNLTRLSQHMSIQAASAQAASIAWGFLKRDGAETRLSKYGDRKVPILIDTHRLEKSLRPGRLLSGSYSPPQDQVFKPSKNSMEIGTSVPYAKKLHKVRKFWPADISPWFRSAVRDALEDSAKALARGKRK